MNPYQPPTDDQPTPPPTDSVGNKRHTDDLKLLAIQIAVSFVLLAIIFGPMIW